MKPTQSIAIESNANSAVEHIDYAKALSNEHRKDLRETSFWLEMQELEEINFVRAETVNRGRAFANNHHEGFFID